LNLPDLNITAAGSGREINLTALGAPVVIVCHGQNTAKAAMEVNTTVRAVHPDAKALVIASVIDLRQFPSMFHGMVKPELEKAYNQAAARLPEGSDPADMVILLPDWDGKIHDALDIQNSTSTAAIVVADAEGNVVGTRQGEDLGTAAIEMLP
jgi:hypothetical protein